jgi:hypothetical protein
MTKSFWWDVPSARSLLGLLGSAVTFPPPPSLGKPLLSQIFCSEFILSKLLFPLSAVRKRKLRITYIFPPESRLVLLNFLNSKIKVVFILGTYLVIC